MPPWHWLSKDTYIAFIHMGVYFSQIRNTEFSYHPGLQTQGRKGRHQRRDLLNRRSSRHILLCSLCSVKQSCGCCRSHRRAPGGGSGRLTRGGLGLFSGFPLASLIPDVKPEKSQLQIPAEQTQKHLRKPICTLQNAHQSKSWNSHHIHLAGGRPPIHLGGVQYVRL